MGEKGFFDPDKAKGETAEKLEQQQTRDNEPQNGIPDKPKLEGDIDDVKEQSPEMSDSVTAGTIKPDVTEESGGENVAEAGEEAGEDEAEAEPD